MRPPVELRQPGHVFEDVVPRLVDVTGDGFPEVIVVQSSFERGARLVVFAADGGAPRLLAATPYIGTRNRWLAPAAIADLDGDGAVELAYVDRPHLAKVLRIWRFEEGRLREVTHRQGRTNHRIGDPFISGGLRTCGAAPEIVLADAGWTRLVAARLRDGRIRTRGLGPLTGPDSFARALECR